MKTYLHRTLAYFTRCRGSFSSQNPEKLPISSDIAITAWCLFEGGANKRNYSSPLGYLDEVVLDCSCLYDTSLISIPAETFALADAKIKEKGFSLFEILPGIKVDLFCWGEQITAVEAKAVLPCLSLVVLSFFQLNCVIAQVNSAKICFEVTKLC